MPNRNIEAPRSTEIQRPTLRPDLIEPRRTPTGQTFQGDQYHRERDRLFDNPAAGARLMVPFSSP
jgi:hypothetical protein